MKNKYKSIYVKLLNNFITILSLGMLVSIIAITYIANKGLNKQYVVDSNQKMKIISIMINNFYEQIDNAINMMVDNPIIKKFDETVTSYPNYVGGHMTSSINGGIEQEIYNIFKNYGSNHSEIKNIYMASVEGRYIRWPEADISEDFDPVKSKWFKAGFESNGEIIRIYPRMDLEKGTVISTVKKVYDNHGNIIGILGIDIRKDIISNILEQITIGETGRFIMVDDNETIIADGRTNKNNFSNIEESYGSTFKKVFDDNISQFTMEIDNEIYSIVPRKIPNTNLTLATIMAEKEIKKYIHAIIAALIFILLTIVASMFYVAINRMNKIIEPINKCAQYLVEIGSGNFNENIDPEYLKREDEIGIIANGIKDMKNSLMVLIYEIKNELRIFKNIADESRYSCIIIYDENYNVVYDNKMAQEHGYIYENIKNRINDKNLFSELEKETLNNIKDALERNDYWSGIIKIPCMGITLDCSVQNVYKSENGSKEFVVMFDDITEKINSERKLIKYEKMKREENLRSNFFSNLSHELRTPLNIFQSTLQILDMKINKDTTEINNLYLKYRNPLKINCQRMLRLINNIVDMSKIDAGFAKAAFVDYDIVRVIEELTLSVVDYAKRKKISVIFDTEIEELIIKCDLDMIERIMLNLLSNAIKFTNHEGNILVYMRADDDWVYIKVKDDGIGIPLEMQETIFDRFVQSNKSSSRLNEGSGIGLAIVHSLVKLNEGQIYLNSDGEHGTEFEILLPNKKLNPEEELGTIYIVDAQNTQLELSDIQ